jgi:serine/threonine protein kinase
MAAVTEGYEAPIAPGTSMKDFVVDPADRVQFGPPRRTGIRQAYKARHVITKKVSFVKEWNGDVDDHEQFTQCNLLVALVHPCFVGIIGVVLPEPGVPGKLIREFMPHGSLSELIADRARYASLSATAKVKIAVGIVYAMRYMHRRGIFHRFLKPTNVLLDGNDEPHIGALRVARLGESGEDPVTADLHGSPHYMAPELPTCSYGEKVDVYAFAMILWEICTGKNVTEGYAKDPGKALILGRASEGLRPATNGLSSFARTLVVKSWATKPGERADFETIARSLKTQRYSLLDGVDVPAIEAYISRIEEFEARYPPTPFEVPFDEDDDE